MVSGKKEKITSTEPAKVVEELSAQKAEAVWEKLAVSGVCQAPDNSADRMHEGCGVCDPEQKSGETTMTDPLVMGADTVVACDGKILGKPADTEAAQGTRQCSAMASMIPGKEIIISEIRIITICIFTKITSNTQRSAYSKMTATEHKTLLRRIAGTIRNPTEIISPHQFQKDVSAGRRRISIFRSICIPVRESESHSGRSVYIVEPKLIYRCAYTQKRWQCDCLTVCN